jgi:hypothetical protein
MNISASMHSESLENKYRSRYNEIKHLRNDVVDGENQKEGKVIYSCIRNKDLSLRDYAILCSFGNLNLGGFAEYDGPKYVHVEIYTD